MHEQIQMDKVGRSVIEIHYKCLLSHESHYWRSVFTSSAHKTFIMRHMYNVSKSIYHIGAVAHIQWSCSDVATANFSDKY